MEAGSTKLVNADAGTDRPSRLDRARRALGWPARRPTLACRVGALALALAVAVLPGGCRSRGPSAAELARPLAPSSPSGALQEVAPPSGTERLRERLQTRSPQVRIERPADGSGLPPGDWTLELRVRDWPLVDAGSLGLGPHLVVQIDQEPPLRVTSRSSDSQPDPRETSQEEQIQISLPPLGPGSHRVTAYAARPWGEAVKASAASHQIRVHRVAPNPLGLPAEGSPQLIPVSPEVISPREPVLIDWLLRDAPLQGLREGDDGWRLRITVNGDSFLVDENTPLWLRGWKRGSNTVLLELVDAQGNPLNPPFNSVVREVWIDPAKPEPIWSQAAPATEELQILLGERPVPPAPAVPEPAPRPTPAPTTRSDRSQAEASMPAEQEESDPDEPGPPDAAAAGAGEGALPEKAPHDLASDEVQVPPRELPAVPQDTLQPVAPVRESGAPESIGEPGAGITALPPEELAPPQPVEPDEPPGGPSEGSETQNPEVPQPQGEASTETGRPPPPPTQDIPTQEPPAGTASARQLVNPDGTLIRPAPRGPLAGLREHWAR